MTMVAVHFQSHLHLGRHHRRHPPIVVTWRAPYFRRTLQWWGGSTPTDFNAILRPLIIRRTHHSSRVSNIRNMNNNVNHSQPHHHHHHPTITSFHPISNPKHGSQQFMKVSPLPQSDIAVRAPRQHSLLSSSSTPSRSLVPLPQPRPVRALPP